MVLLSNHSSTSAHWYRRGRRLGTCGTWPPYMALVKAKEIQRAAGGSMAQEIARLSLWSVLSTCLTMTFIANLADRYEPSGALIDGP